VFKNKKFLAVIPARGGSKRLPGKNVLELAGKPLIAWTIEAAKNSRYIDDIVVTTDDYEIARIAKMYGASVPFMRPDELSTDEAKTIDVVAHVIQYYSNNNTEFDYIILLQPTSPLREAYHIDKAIERILEKKFDSLVSVCEAEHSPLWSNVIPENGDMSHFLSEKLKDTRGQDLPTYYRLNGAIYICICDKLLEEHTFFLSSSVCSFEMSTRSSVDIDDKLGFDFANFLMSIKEG